MSTEPERLTASLVHRRVRPEVEREYRAAERALSEAVRTTDDPAARAVLLRNLDALRSSPRGAAVRRGTW